MKYIGIDYETYYDQEYSLKKMTPVEYILDPRFQCLGLAVREDFTGPQFWVDGPDVPKYYKSIRVRNPTSKVLMFSHNGLFDMCIASWVHDYVPDIMSCTLAITRAVAKHKLGLLPSLKKTAKFLGLADKGDFIGRMAGVRYEQFKNDPYLYQGLVNYALNDVDLAVAIFGRLVYQTRAFPASELLILDNVLRAAASPKFLLDQRVLIDHYRKVVSDKEKLLIEAGVADKKELMSNDRFAALLQNLGVEPPTKISPTTGRVTYAFAKQDLGFLALETDPDPAVQALFAARVGNKSTLEETRTLRMMKISRLKWPHHAPQSMPMPLRYSAAHTDRLGGDWQLNVQNMPRKSPLRQALMAGAGKMVVAGDSSQIECRLVATTCGASQLVLQFENKEDVYSTFASIVFGFPVNKNDHPTERFVGKQGVLGLGFGLGAEGFDRRIKVDSKNQTGKMIVLAEGLAQRVVDTFRHTYRPVPIAWRMLGQNGIAALSGATAPWQWGLVTFEREIIHLPNGRYIRYMDLRFDTATEEWTYDTGYEGRKRIYGPKILENVIQALARIITMEVGMRMRIKYDLYWSLQAHDELVYIVPDNKAEETRHALLEEMVVRPKWLPNVPLSAECKIGATYADAK